MSGEAVLLFTKPARPGRVKTRLVGELTPEEAARLHAAFLGDLGERLARGRFHLEIAWALEDGEEIPAGPLPGSRQVGADLGARLFHALSGAGRRFDAVAAVGSDHPELGVETVEDAFVKLGAGAEVVLGPVPDGGYYLIGLARHAVRRELFEGIPWSTATVLEDTLARARRLGLAVELLAEGHDVDRPDDLAALARRLSASGDCPRTRGLLASWGRLRS
jgi:hypothetical protein